MKRQSKSIRAGVVFLAVSLGMCLQGCYPWAEHRQESPEYRGMVLDAETKQPVPKTKLEICGGGMKSSTKSKDDGSFRLEPLRRFHGGMMTLEGIKPDSPSPPERLVLRLSQHGYQSTQLEATNYLTGEAWFAGVELGNILLQPVPAAKK